MWTSRLRYTAIAVSALAAACGGGGDGGDYVAPQLPPTYVLISATNQDTVARASIASIMPFTSVPVLSASPGPVLAQATQASGLAAQGRAGLTHLALRAIAFGDQPPPSMPLGIGRPLALFQETAPCLVSGSMAVIG